MTVFFDRALRIRSVACEHHLKEVSQTKIQGVAGSSITARLTEQADEWGGSSLKLLDTFQGRWRVFGDY